MLRTVVPSLWWLVSGWLLFSCQSNDPLAHLPDTELSGAQLAQRYCGSCHLFPEPELLDRNTWLHSVLPAMSWRLGIRDSTYQPPRGRNMNEQYLIQRAGIFPDSALLSEESWQKIVSYYDSLAPAQLSPLATKIDTIHASAPFAPHPISLGLSTGGLTTLLRQHPETGKLYLGDGTKMLYQLDENGIVEDFFELPGLVSDIHFCQNGEMYLLTIGNLHPHDEPLGQMITMDSQGNTRSLIRQLNRPVHMNVHDVDQDGREDIIICEFGNYLGRLSWFRRTEGDTFQRHVLWENPGAVKTYVRDHNQDGRPDIIALLAQGREGVYAFYQQDDGRFGMKPLLQFPPVFGTSDFVLTDIDQDGDEDIVLANGDNADLSPILKPYHGVRVYLNDGDAQFTEAYFCAMYGATRLISEDFDQDGDVDVAASAYFPDFKADNSLSFVYLENTTINSLAFAPRMVEGLRVGRWLVMEPLYQPGKKAPGIVLGSFNLGLPDGLKEEGERWNTANVNLMILDNVGGSRE